MNQNREPTRFIISDLHLGKNDAFDIFRADGKEDAFEAFLEFCSGQEGPVELVINGDFVDFLQLQPWDAYRAPKGAKKTFVKDAAVKKAAEIATENARVFRALGKFLGDAKNRIVVLLGNHDVELAYCEVWAVIRDAIVGSTGIKGVLAFRNRVTQYNFQVGGVTVHVQHGNIRDPWNEILYKQLFDNAEKNSGFDYPPGTLFVYDIMNRFKKRFRFVDLLKPEMPAVPLVLAQLEPLAVAAAMPKAFLAKLSALKNGFIGQVRAWVGGGSFAEAASPEASSPEAAAEQRAYIAMADRYITEVRSRRKLSGREEMPDELDVQHLEEFLAETHPEAAASQPGFGRRWDEVKAYLVNSVLNHLGRPAQPNDKSFFKQDQTGDDVDSAKQEFIGDVKIVVFGHTHAALKAEMPGKGLYLNSGTWANLLALPREVKDVSAWLDSILDNSFEPLVFLTYVRLVPKAGGVEAALNYWSDGEKVLWSKHISA